MFYKIRTVLLDTSGKFIAPDSTFNLGCALGMGGACSVSFLSITATRADRRHGWGSSFNSAASWMVAGNEQSPN